MKFHGRLLFLVAIVGVLLSYSSCKKDEDPGKTVEDQQLEKLSKTWVITTATLDGIDKTADYTNFALTISGIPGATSFGYNVAGSRPSPNPWLPSGTWVFGANPETQITRDSGTADELPLTYAVTDTQLQISFSFNGAGYPGARTSNVTGQWVFTFGL